MKHIKLNGYLVTCVVISRKFIGLCVDNLIKKASDLHVYITKGGILIRSIYFAKVFYMQMEFCNDLDLVCDDMLFYMTVHVKNVYVCLPGNSAKFCSMKYNFQTNCL